MNTENSKNVENTKSLELFGAWGGCIYILLTGLAWILLADIVPPHMPSSSAEQIAKIVADRHWQMTFCAVCMLFSCFFLTSYSAVLTLLIKEVEGKFGVLTLSTLIAMVITILESMFSGVLWGLAAFRIERAPELILLINDLAWLIFMGCAPPIFFAWAGVAYAALVLDKGNKIFPRWYGYINLWLFIAIIPGVLSLVFKSGPFAWNGLIVFWFAFLPYVFVYLVSPMVFIPAVKKYL